MDSTTLKGIHEINLITYYYFLLCKNSVTWHLETTLTYNYIYNYIENKLPKHINYYGLDKPKKTKKIIEGIELSAMVEDTYNYNLTNTTKLVAIRDKYNIEHTKQLNPGSIGTIISLLLNTRVVHDGSDWYLFTKHGWNISDTLTISKFIHINIIPLIYKLTLNSEINADNLIKIINQHLSNLTTKSVLFEQLMTMLYEKNFKFKLAKKPIILYIL
ncbi:hypothetical protein LY90DRAFT_642455 [Neocallimastix californiae]|jgi:hypothetical protein|uniref:Uncharacterized protein n=1 Tax=Neocallimastix californiae TaxID=1754190 RepID=A0A1Y1YJB0_9FUNG|nr:hypothetical protein LY90DRAFT_642455 [Neocallimastix californiae]|eukprot:ORX97943.1 hypothetical protein LY90DRAFT_642455 [Neocallimastix californiae]